MWCILVRTGVTGCKEIATLAGKTVRSTVLLPEPLHRQVQAVAAAHDVSSAWVIRQAVLQYLSTRAGQVELPLGASRS